MPEYRRPPGKKRQQGAGGGDPQASATSGLGIDVRSLEHSIYDAVLDQCDGYEGVPILQVILETNVENLKEEKSGETLKRPLFLVHSHPGSFDRRLSLYC